MLYVNIYLNIIGVIINTKRPIYRFQPIKTSFIEKPVIYKLYYAYKNRKSEAQDGFDSLSVDEQEEVISILERMVTEGEKFYIPTKIKWKLKGYKYGEIKTSDDRFFFFKVIKNNLVFFAYNYKDQDSLGSDRYKQLNKKYLEYEKEFKRKKD